MEKPSQFQLDIASSDSFVEFRMKNNLSGLYDVPEREIIKQLIKEYFIEDYICGDYNVYKERPKILKWLREYDEHPEYIVNNDAANFLFELLSSSVGYVSYNNTIVIDYARMLNTKDNTFFGKLRDSNGNNILMVMVKVFKFDEYNECLSQVGFAALSKTGIIENFLNSNHLIFEFVKFLLNECNIDPNLKNKNNVCFMDYISNEYYESLIENDT